MSSGRLRERRMRVSRWNVQERNWNYEDTFGANGGCDGIPCRAILSIEKLSSHRRGENATNRNPETILGAGERECNFPFAPAKACENNDKSLAEKNSWLEQ